MAKQVHAGMAAIVTQGALKGRAAVVIKKCRDFPEYWELELNDETRVYAKKENFIAVSHREFDRIRSAGVRRRQWDGWSGEVNKHLQRSRVRKPPAGDGPG